MALKINYVNKTGTNPKGQHENQVWDVDMNEIKNVVNSNADDIDSNKADTVTNAQNIATNAGNISQNVLDISENANNILINSGNISNNETDIATNATNIATNAGNISTNATNISTNTTNIQTNTDAIASITGDITDNEAAILLNAQNIASNDIDIANNTTAIGDNATAINTNIDNIAANAVNIATNTSNISDNATNIGDNTTNISTNRTDIDTNTTNIGVNATNISDNAANISINAGNIASNDVDIANNTALINTNITDIANNAANIQTNTDNIALLSSPLNDTNQPTPYTFQLGDENSIITYNNANDGEYLIPLESSQAFNIGDIITVDSSLNVGDVQINGVSGVTFETAGTDTYNKVLNIKKVGSNSWRVIGNYKEVYNQGTAPTINGTPVYNLTPFVPNAEMQLIRDFVNGVWYYDWRQLTGEITNYYMLPNAANPDNEVNATTGSDNNPNWVISSVSTNPTAYDGSFCLKWEHQGPDNTAYSDNLTLSLESGVEYSVSLFVNRIAGANFTIGLYDFKGWAITDSVTIGASLPVDTWTEYTFTGTTTNTAPLLAVSCTDIADTGASIAIDKIVITKV